MQEKISYEEIRAKKKEEYGTEFTNYSWIFVDQYKDRTHFLFELLQNAEDEKATYVNIELHQDMVVIEHNGGIFSKADVISITNIGKSTKKEKSNGKIGKFGIGFKSVYAYTNAPRIYSGDYSFEIHELVYPYSIDPKQIATGITRIEIPFNKEDVPAKTAFAEIEKSFSEQITATTLLFLESIKEIDLSVEGKAGHIHISTP